MSNRFRYCLIYLVAIVLLFWVRPTVAQKPILRLDTVNPTSQIFKLVFSADGKRLYSAGKDKVVREWDVIRRGNQVSLLLAHKYRWTIARGPNGHIYDVEVSPNGILAFAGYSAWTQKSVVVVYDTKTRKLVKKLFTDPSERVNVSDLAFSPSGNRLAAVTVLGEIRMWNIGTWHETVLDEPKKQVSIRRQVCFQGENKLVTQVVLPREKGVLKFFDITAKSSGVQKFEHNLIVGIRDIANRTLVSADIFGDVFLWPKGKKGQYLRKAPRPFIEEISALTIHPNQEKIFIALSERDAKTGTLEIWNSDTRKRIARKEVSTNSKIWALDASPRGDLVALGVDGQIQILDLKNGLKKLVETSVESAVSNRLSCSSEVDTFRVALTSVDNENKLVFDPSKSELVSADDPLALSKWRGHDHGAGNYSIEYKVATIDDNIVRLKVGGKKHGNISIDLSGQGKPTCHCWLTNGKETVAVAIGTTFQDGIFIYRLEKDASGRFPLLRYFRDHEAEVTALSTTADGKYLVSASADKTIKTWSLEGLFEQKANWSPSWGATFVAKNAQTVEVKDSLKSGIANARGLKNGTRIIAIKNRSGKVVNSATEMLKALNDSKLWITITVKSDGGPDNGINIKPAWEPVLTTLISTDGQWATWTPFGYYNSSPLGDELFGWQLNPTSPTVGQLKFFKSSQFRGDFEKPRAIEKLLELGNIEDALAWTPPPKKETPPKQKDIVKLKQPKKTEPATDPVPKIDPVPNTVAGDAPKRKPVKIPPAPVHKVIANLSPGIEILSPQNVTKDISGINVKFTAQIDIEAGTALDAYVIRGTVSGADLGKPEMDVVRTDKGTRATIHWSESLDSGHYTFKVTAQKKSGARNYSDEVSFYSLGNESTEIPKLFLVGIAADKYQPNLKLQFPVADVDAVLEKMPRVTAKFFESQDRWFRQNSQISKEFFPVEVGEILEDLKKESDPRDLLVVYVAGHGAAKDGQYYFVPPAKNLKSFDQLAADPGEFGISWNVIASLADCGCRTVFILDTCYGGDVLEGAKARIRPLFAKEAMVISASSAGQLAYESKDLGNGIFSGCLLRGLDMLADENNNEVVDLDELIVYLKREVRKESDQIIKQGLLQDFARARGSSAVLLPQQPVSSTHNFGLVELASPVKE